VIFMPDKNLLLADLEQSYAAARRLSAQSLAGQIERIGFQCLGCGQCCRGDDNSVVVFPFEVRRIMAKRELDWLEVAQPPEEGEWDNNGNFHTLEWRLKKEGLRCRFYDEGQCTIYGQRPLLCRTYPFYLVEGELRCSECPGLGMRINEDAAQEIAGQLILRHITEIVEAIALTKKYQDFQRGGCKEGNCCIIHDSEGEHKIPLFTAQRS
jgi:hypothetical protein